MKRLLATISLSFFLLLIVLTIGYLYYDYSIKKSIPESVKKIIDNSKGNKKEFYKLIKHYQYDSLKLEAAYFLIKNMENKYSVLPMSDSTIFKTSLKKISTLKEKVAWDPTTNSVVNIFLDSLLKKEHPRYRIVRDLYVITAQFLIDNIDLAFEVWNKSSKRQYYDFEIFCEYVLPYRFKNEPLSNWRKVALNKFKSTLNLQKTYKDIGIEIIKKSNINYNFGMDKYPYSLSFEDIDALGVGNCDHMSLYLTLALRALGIPSTTDFTPNWANRSSGHEWNVIYNESRNFEGLGFNDTGKNDLLYKASKIYRNSFSHKMEPTQYKFWKEYPSFGYIFNEDITDSYQLTSDIVYEDLDKNFTYILCTFNNQEWVPTSLGMCNGNNIVFSKIGRGKYFDKCQPQYKNDGKGIVYSIMKIKDKKSTFINYPFILYENGEIKVLKPNFTKKQSIKLIRKYPEYNHFSIYKENMQGITIETSEDSTFKKNKIIREITSIPETFCLNIDIRTTTSQYVRLKSAKSNPLDISQLSFYNKNERLTGRFFSSLNNNSNSSNMKNLNDNNILTFCNISGGSNYIAIDFGKKKTFDYINICCRTDDNEIAKNEMYELFYFDKTWVSLGIKKSESPYLIYNEVPSNALFLLKNVSKGVENRGFTWENESQIWW